MQRWLYGFDFRAFARTQYARLLYNLPGSRCALKTSKLVKLRPNPIRK